MERLLNQDERIRRAEEIYARRQNLRERTKRATVNVSQPKNFKLLKRVILQIIICMLIYFIFYLINTTNYSFSQVTLDKTNELISEDVDFMSIYNNIVNSINNYIYSGTEQTDTQINEENKIEETNTIEESQSNENVNAIVEAENQETEQENTEQDQESTEEVQENKEQTQSNESTTENNEEETTGQEKISTVEESETDRIKNKYSFIVPTKRIYFFRIRNKRTNV